MDTRMSLADVLARLDQQIGYHREQEAFHAGHEAFHHEQRSIHAGELEQLTRHFEAVKAAAAATADLVARSPAAGSTAPAIDEVLGRGRRLRLARVIAKLVARKGPQEVFGARSIAAELTRFYGDRLRGPVTERRVSVSLRWLASSKQIFRVTKGGPYREGHYVRERPPGGK